MRQYTRNSVAVAFTLVLLASAVVAGLSASALAQTTAPTETNETEAGAQATGESWSTYRADAGRSGATTADGPEPYVTQRWSDAFSGEPAGAPTVVDGTAYVAVLTELEYYKNVGAVAAYDAASGDVRWQRTGLGQPEGAPTVVGDTVYVSTLANYDRPDSYEEEDGNGGLYALDVETGETQWVRNGSEQWFDAPIHEHGTLYAIRSPEDGQPGNTSLVALDPNTGETEWSVDADELVGVSGETVFTRSGDDVEALDVRSGEKLYGIDRSNGDNSDDFVVTDDAVYSFGDTTDEVRAQAFSTDTGERMWNTTVQNSIAYVGMPAANGDAVFLTVETDSDSTAVVRLDSSSGAESWRFERTEGVLAGGPTVGNGTVYAGGGSFTEATEPGEYGLSDRNYNVFALNADNGTQQWAYSTESQFLGEIETPAPAVVDGALYLSRNTVDWPVSYQSAGVTVLESNHTKPDEAHTPSDGYYEEDTALEARIDTTTVSDPGPGFGTEKTFGLNGSSSSVRYTNITTYEWDVDDDGEFETTGEEISVTVERCVSRTVTLRVTSDDGTTDTESVVLRNR